MAIKVEHKITGLEDLFSNLDKLNRSARNQVIRQALEESAKPVLNEARRRVPVDTGKLRDSLVIDEPVLSFKGSGSIRILASHNLGGFHAHLVELGTSRQSAQPFLRPALRNTRKQQRAAFVEAVNDGIRKAIR